MFKFIKAAFSAVKKLCSIIVDVFAVTKENLRNAFTCVFTRKPVDSYRLDLELDRALEKTLFDISRYSTKPGDKNFSMVLNQLHELSNAITTPGQAVTILTIILREAGITGLSIKPHRIDFISRCLELSEEDTERLKVIISICCKRFNELQGEFSDVLHKANWKRLFLKRPLCKVRITDLTVLFEGL